MKMENLKFINNTIIHWIDKTDVKSNIILALKFFILGYFLNKFNFHFIERQKDFIFFIFILSSALSFLFLIRIIYPKLSTGEASSIIYFKHISDKYRQNKKQAEADLMEIDDESFKRDLIGQIVSLSVVAECKYKDLQKGIFFMIIEVLFLILLFV